MALTGFRNYGILEAGDNPNTLSIGKPLGQNAGMLLEATGQIIWLWNNATTAWVSYDLGALSSASGDGNNTAIARGNAVENVAPTAGEVPSPINGDTASVYLTNGLLEYWVYSGASWSKAFTVDAASISNALVTLSGVAAGSTNLGVFSGGTVIGDNVTIYTALNQLDTALTNLSTTLSNLGILDPAMGPYDSHAAATADAGLLAGRMYYLSITNLEFAYSAGSKGPFYKK